MADRSRMFLFYASASSLVGGDLPGGSDKVAAPFLIREELGTTAEGFAQSEHWLREFTEPDFCVVKSE